MTTMSEFDTCFKELQGIEQKYKDKLNEIEKLILNQALDSRDLNRTYSYVDMFQESIRHWMFRVLGASSYKPRSAEY